MTDLIIISLFKFLLQKLFAKLKIKIDKVHILSTLTPLLVFLIISYIYKKNLEYTVLVSLIFLMGSYILVNVPGICYFNQIRIFEIINENNIINKNDFYLKYNDEILFNDRFERINTI